MVFVVPVNSYSSLKSCFPEKKIGELSRSGFIPAKVSISD